MSTSLRHTSFLVLLAVITGCNEGYRTITPDEQESTPNVSNTTDTVTYFVQASQFTHSQSMAITFASPQLLRIDYLVSGFAEGTCIVELRDSNGTIARLDTLRSDTTSTSTILMWFKPRYLTIQFLDFTGSVALSLQRQQIVSNLEISDFPYQQGAWWRYRVRNINYPVWNDTASVRAVLDTTINGNVAALWVMTHFFSPESMYVVQSGETLQMIERSYWSDLKFNDIIFPLWFAKRWSTPQVAPDESKVIAVESTTVPAGSFSICYVVNEVRSTGPGIPDGYQTAWLAPGVGIVRLQRISAFESWEWELIDYSMP